MNVQQALEMVTQTDSGMVRSHNEDSLVLDSSCGLAVLADGMGGYNAGEVASNIAISVVSKEVKRYQSKIHPGKKSEIEEGFSEELLRESIIKANTAILSSARKQPEYAGMGTTIVSALFYDNRVAVAHVGDSRLYRLRADYLESITLDHSLLQEQINEGFISKEEARLSRNKNLVTRALGVEIDVEVETHVHEVKVGDIYLLCSDGLNDMLEDDEICATLVMYKSNVPLAAERLIQLANDKGGKDNVSVILVKINSDFAVSASWFEKLLLRFKKTS